MTNSSTCSSTVYLKIPQFSLPLATSIVSRATDIERENFTLGKVVLKELAVRYPRVVNWAAGTCLPIGGRKEGGREGKRKRELLNIRFYNVV